MRVFVENSRAIFQPRGSSTLSSRFIGSSGVAGTAGASTLVGIGIFSRSPLGSRSEAAGGHIGP